MKKIVIIGLMIITFISCSNNVFAENVDLNFKTKVHLEEKLLEEGEFEFNLKDNEGKIIQTKKNDSEGNVIFDKETIETSSNTPVIFKIEQVQNNKDKYEYDSNVAYIRFYNNEIKYYKENPSDIELRESKLVHHDDSKAFHATEDELQGQAYAVLDKDTGILTFFRDDVEKYENYQEIDNKIYFTYFEDRGYSSWSSRNDIKKIVFKDAIKPNKIEYWFYYLTNLEEVDLRKLDTSFITDMSELFKGDINLKTIDLSTFDTSNVKSFSDAFYNCVNLEEIIIYNWDLSKVKNFTSMLDQTPNLKYIDIQNMNNLYNDELNLHTLFSNTGVKYIEMPALSDYSNINYISLGAFIQDAKDLEYLDLSKIEQLNSYKYRKWLISASFVRITNLKTLKIGDCFDPYPDNIPSGVDRKYAEAWYNTNNNTFYNFVINEHYNEECPFPKGTYIQFREDNVEFYNKVRKTQNIINNPETNNEVLLIIIILIATLTLFLCNKYYNYRIKKNIS